MIKVVAFSVILKGVAFFVMEEVVDNSLNIKEYACLAQACSRILSLSLSHRLSEGRLLHFQITTTKKH